MRFEPIKYIKEFLKRGNSIDKTNQYKNIGTNVHICAGEIAYKENIEIGDNVYIGGNSSIWGIGGLSIGDNTIIGPRVTIHTSNHNWEHPTMLPYDNRSIMKKVEIGANCWLGDNVMICPGVHIGEGAVVAMGSVVTKDVPPLSLVGGNPAKVIKRRDQREYEKLLKEKKFYLKEKFKI